MNRINSETPPPYTPDNDAAIIAQALDILGARLRKPGAVMDSPATTRAFLCLKLAEREHEIFAVLFLDTRHRVIAYEEIFHGTVDGAAVYPREIVKRALALNAAAVVLAHNHPSGEPDPSRADENLTVRLKDVLALVDVRVLDHIIIGGRESVSLAERGAV